MPAEPDQILETAELHAPYALPLAAIAIPAFAAALLASQPLAQTAFLSTGFTLIAVASLIRSGAWRRKQLVEKRMRTVKELLEHAPAPCFATDMDGQVRYSNAAATERFGKSAGRSLVSAIGHLFASPGSVMFRLQNRALAAGNASEEIVTRKGHARLVVQKFGADGFVWRLEEIGERTGRAGEPVSLPMLTASKTGTVLFVNEPMRRLLGSRPSALDRVIAEVPAQSGAVATVATRDGPVRMTVVMVEGAANRTEYYLLPASDEASRESLTTLDGLPVPAMTIARDGTVRNMNRLAREVFGLREGTGLPVSRLLEGPGKALSEWVREAFDGRGLYTPEVLRALTSARPETYLQVNLSRTTDGADTYLTAVLSDATELKTLEAKFVQSQKMQAIGQLAGGVAHDFNNLLTAISGHCDLLLLRHDKGDPDYGDLIQIHQNANRAAALVGQLLAFSRKQNLAFETVDLRDTLSDLMHLLNRLVGERVTLSLVHDPDLQPITADKRQLEQVFMNLVVNARDAMPGGGAVTIETENVVLTEPMHRDRATLPPGDYTVVRVSDEGQGIPPDQVEKIFEPFFTTKRVGEGTGLGLSTVYGIVKQTGGYIFVDSVVGSGTCFTLLFPAAPGAPEEKPAPPPPRAVPVLSDGSGVVLLVEDEAPVRSFASRALRMRGYTVIEAENAEEALHLLEDEGLKVDIFVTDVIMPGLDGPTWVQKALERRPGVRVVFVSGYAEDHFADGRTSIPNSVFLPKPFTLSDLTATIQGQAVH